MEVKHYTDCLLYLKHTDTCACTHTPTSCAENTMVIAMQKTACRVTRRKIPRRGFQDVLVSCELTWAKILILRNSLFLYPS